MSDIVAKAIVLLFYLIIGVYVSVDDRYHNMNIQYYGLCNLSLYFE